MIKLATIFSGIGAIEQALLRLGLDYHIVFACDNGDVELNLLEGDDLVDYKRLTKMRSKKQKLSNDETNRLNELSAKEKALAETIRDTVRQLKTKDEKREYPGCILHAGTRFVKSFPRKTRSICEK